MGQSVVLNLGQGNWQQGFPWVIAQLWEANSLTPMQFTGSLPPAPELEELYPRWQTFYDALYSRFSWRRLRHITTNNLSTVSGSVSDAMPDIEINETDITNVSEEEFHDLCLRLRYVINHWLESSEFRKIDQRIRTRLAPDSEVRFIVTAEDHQVLRLPWCLWHFLDDYPHAEIALGPLEYRRSIRTKPVAPSSSAVKILAILGNRDGIDVEQDQRLLEQLPQTELHFLVEPDRTTLNQMLWEPGWDILFFAGHSSSKGKGQIQINQSDSITIDQLKYGLKHAIAQGLKLAIFNSCDGLGLAQDLADLSIPQVIVMREPVPDQVAQAFLKHFLSAFSQGQSLYAAVRESREKLQALETEFPCATWLPIICQNPAEEPILWRDLRPAAVSETHPTPLAPQSMPSLPSRESGWRRLMGAAAVSLAVAGLMLGVRSLGVLEPMELWGFDLLLRLRPYEQADPRLVVVTIDDDDIRAQTQPERRGSLADATLEQLLETLKRAKVGVIGLDVYRDYPVSAGYTNLATHLKQSDRLIAICKSRDAEADPAGVAPPPEVRDTHLGFSDFIKDDDGILRRHLLLITPDPASPCATPYAFSAQIAFTYLSTRNIPSSFTSDGNLEIGNTVFPRLSSRVGGYQPADAGGNQILLNYRALPSPDKIAAQISLTKLLSGQINLDALEGKIVLIGVTAASSGDYWATPYGTTALDEVAGVFIQAHMVSQLLSAVLDNRPLLWTWPWWGDGLWILTWSLVGGVGVLYLRRMSLAIATLAAVGILSGCCFVAVLHGGWIAWIPAGLALMVTGGSVIYIQPKFDSKS